MSAEVRDALLAAQDAGWADPDRLYREGRRARLLLDAARESVAASIGGQVRPDQVAFTGSGALARQLAVLGIARGASGPVAASAVEHSEILACADQRGLVTVPVDRTCRVQVAEAIRAARGAAAICLQAANGEIGTLQPVLQVADRIDIPLVTDASHLLGHAPVPDGWSVLVASAETFGAPAPIGILAVRGGDWRSPLPAPAGPGVRVAGVADVPTIVAAARALELRLAATARYEHVRALVDVLRERLPAVAEDIEVLGDAHERLPHLLTFTCLYADGGRLVEELDRHGFTVASGSACVADTRRPSHVLAAMGALTHGNLRLGLPLEATLADVERFLQVLPAALTVARQAAG